MRQVSKDPLAILPDACVATILEALPSTKATGPMRLVCRVWRTRTSALLRTLRPCPGCSLDAVVLAFPALSRLTLTLRPECQVRLGSLAALPALSSLCLIAPWVHQELDCSLLCPLAPTLRVLVMHFFSLRRVGALAALCRLESMGMATCVIAGGEPNPCLVASSQHQSLLHELTTPAEALASGMDRLTGLRTLSVDGLHPHDPTLAAGLVHLTSLARLTLNFRLLARTRSHAGSEDCTLGVLRAAAAAPCLACLEVSGDATLSDEAVQIVGTMAGLEVLDLELGTEMDSPPFTITFPMHRGEGTASLAPLSRLSNLQHLILRNANLAIEGSLGALASCIHLRQLVLRAPRGLGDTAAHALRTLEGLRCLCIVDCPDMTDWGLHTMLKPMRRLRNLSLSMMSKSITTLGLDLSHLPELEVLTLGELPGIGDQDLAEILTNVPTLKDLKCFDMDAGDVSCAALLASVPGLESVNMEFTNGLSQHGLELLLGLPRLSVVHIVGCGMVPDKLPQHLQQLLGRGDRIPHPASWMAKYPAYD